MRADLTPVGDPEIDRQLAERVAARREADRPLPPPRLPAAEEPWQQVADQGDCTSAARLVKKATAAGWHVATFRARGPLIGADGQPLATADALLLMFSWAKLEAWAIWYRRDDKWKFGSAHYLHPIVGLSSPELGKWLTE